MFGPSYSDIQGALDHQSATAIALVRLLLEKGVFTEEEFTATRNMAVACVDQVQAQRRDEAIKDDPLASFFAQLLGGHAAPDLPQDLGELKWPDGE